MDRDDLGNYKLKSKFEKQNRLLPIATIRRMMKTALPGRAGLTLDAQQCMQDCVSEFISFITSEAAEKREREKRRNELTGDDILASMEGLGFENYAEALKIYLARYRENKQQMENAASSRAPVKAVTDGEAATDGEVATDGETTIDGESPTDGEAAIDTNN